MSFLKNIYNIFSDSREIQKPIIIKECNENSPTIQQLTVLLESNDPSLDVTKIQNHLKLFSIGQTGEKSVLFELQHSMLPLLVLHDVYLEFEEYKAQLDFVIVTHKFILVLEVKKLFGNIHITEQGEFQRVITKNNRVVNKEGMYSPINQVERHVGILDHFLRSMGIISKCPVRHAVTFANPKTIIDIHKNAPASIRSNVIRHDQIKSFLQKELKKESPVFMLDEPVRQIANTILEHSTEKSFTKEDYIKQANTPVPPKPIPGAEKTIPKQPVTNTQSKPSASQRRPNITSAPNNTRALLTNYRLTRSRELNIKPYHIFSNQTLDLILEHNPTTLTELLSIEGIGKKKAEEYGTDILCILQKEHSSKIEVTKTTSPLKASNLEERLTQFRTKKARELNAKPYYIFTNKTLELLVSEKPTSMEALLKIEGIGVKKAEEFGKGIVEVIKEG